MTNSITPTQGLTLKAIDASIKKLLANSSNVTTQAALIANNIVALNNNDAFQRSASLLNAVDGNVKLQKQLIAFFKGKIPHSFRTVEGKYKLSALNKELLMTSEQLAKADKVKADKMAITKEKTAKAREAKQEKIEGFDALSLELENLKKDKSRTSKAALNRLEADVTKFKVLAKEKEATAKAANESALIADNRLVTALNTIEQLEATVNQHAKITRELGKSTLKSFHPDVCNHPVFCRSYPGCYQ